MWGENRPQNPEFLVRYRRLAGTLPADLESDIEAYLNAGWRFDMLPIWTTEWILIIFVREKCCDEDNQEEP